MKTMVCYLPDLMASRGINQKDLAIVTGLSPTTISKLYRNQIDRFDRKTLLILLDYFQCDSLSELLEIVESQS